MENITNTNFEIKLILKSELEKQKNDNDLSKEEKEYNKKLINDLLKDLEDLEDYKTIKVYYNPMGSFQFEIVNELQDYFDTFIENNNNYDCVSFTYANIVYDNFNDNIEKLKGAFMNYGLKEKLSNEITNYFDSCYLDCLNGDCEPLYNKLKYADIKLILDIIDISELQEIIDDFLESYNY